MDLIWRDFSHRCECWMWICEWCCISVYFWNNLTYYVFLNLHSYDTRAKLEAWQLPGTCVDFSTSSLVDHIEHCKHRFVLFNLFLFCSRYHDIQICWKKLGAYRSWFHLSWKLNETYTLSTNFYELSSLVALHASSCVRETLPYNRPNICGVFLYFFFFFLFKNICGLLRLSINGKTLSRPITGIILFLFSSRYNTWPSA